MMKPLALPPPPGPNEPSDTLPSRRTWLISAGVAGGAAAVVTSVPFVASLAPSERARALGAAVEVDIGDLAPGELRTVEWRGKPVWVMRRTPEMLATLTAHAPDLADPLSERDGLPDSLRNPGRSLRPDVLVAVGICTHLGCSPTAVPAGSSHPAVGERWSGGFFCPCHGSTFDLAGRVFRNKPAPTNLEIPPHRYLSDSRLVIGEADAA